jgi:hypothetical protein
MKGSCKNMILLSNHRYYTEPYLTKDYFILRQMIPLLPPHIKGEYYKEVFNLAGKQANIKRDKGSVFI